MQGIQKEHSLTLPGGIGKDILEEVPCELAFEGWVGVNRLGKLLWDCEQIPAMSGCQAGRKDEEGNYVLFLSLSSGSILYLAQ